jgi:hypothetical protein
MAASAINAWPNKLDDLILAPRGVRDGTKLPHSRSLRGQLGKFTGEKLE